MCVRTNSKSPRSCFVSGHGFSRAAMVGSDEGFSPWPTSSLFEGHRLQPVHKRNKTMGPCGAISLSLRLRAAFGRSTCEEDITFVAFNKAGQICNHLRTASRPSPSKNSGFSAACKAARLAAEFFSGPREGRKGGWPRGRRISFFCLKTHGCPVITSVFMWRNLVLDNIMPAPVILLPRGNIV